MKEAYIDATMEVIHFSVADVILTSATAGDPMVTYTYPEPDEDMWNEL